MAQLFKNTIIHQIFGANTDVGKTIITTALLRASASLKRRVLYLKPISTGPQDEEDDRFVRTHTQSYRSNIVTKCLYRLQDPVSPHLAATRAQAASGLVLATPSDATFVASLANSLKEFSYENDTQNNEGHIFVETAGGVHSPTLSGTSQAEAYRPLLMPTILIGESKLGGISTTISAYESLLLRGFTIDAVLLFQNNYYKNEDYLRSYFSERGVQCMSLPSPPFRNPDSTLDLSQLSTYYFSLEQNKTDTGVSALVSLLNDKHSKRIVELDSMPNRTLETVWWPFVQHGNMKSPADVTVIDSAYGDFFSVYGSSSSPQHPSRLNSYFDGSASWWTQTLGHAHTELTLAAAHAAGRYGHVMFPEATHLPALQLAERLVKDGPGRGWASRVFFSDDGSTAMEVALKMALRASAKRFKLSPGEERKRLGVLGLAGSYHGDTLGAMDACQEGVYTCEWHDAKGYWIEPPAVGIRNGQPVVSLPEDMASAFGMSTQTFDSLQTVYALQQRDHSKLAQNYRTYIQNTLIKLGLTSQDKPPRIGALVLEPLVMGAGGMIFVDPLFQKLLVEEVRKLERNSRSSDDWHGLPVIFDEVFVGLYRLGLESASPLLGVLPDISVNAKILTGGLVPLAVTLARKSIFEVFLSDRKEDSLLHGHSYTAHPIGCDIANKTLELVAGLNDSIHWKESQKSWKNPDSECTIWSFWKPDFVQRLSMCESVEEVMTLGTVLAIRFNSKGISGYTSSAARDLLSSIAPVANDDQVTHPTPGQLPFGIHFRTLGNVAYFMGSLNTSPEIYRALERRILGKIR